MSNSLIHKISSCRVCQGTSLQKVLSFGPTPLANAFLTKEQLDLPESYYPLDVYYCNTCSFLELGHVVSPKVLFKDYVYVSSTSKVFVDHFISFAKSVAERFQITSKNLVIDIGSNDGILLKPFKKLGASVLGIEPVDSIARVARTDGVETIAEFFSVSLARRIVRTKGRASVVTANNVFAHIDNLDEVIRGLDVLLDTEGVFIMEAPYLVDFLKKRYFDLVYHEHLSYWAISPLITLFKRFNMKVFDVQKVDSHGGSIRVFIAKSSSKHVIGKSVSRFLALEKSMKLRSVNTYREYERKILTNKLALLNVLGTLKKQGKKIVGYGAPAKGNTLLNFFGIGIETLDYIVDSSPLKQGLYSPGKKIPVVSPAVLQKDSVDYILVLAWNFAESIISNTASIAKKAKFIIPVPTPKIVKP